MNKGLFLSHNQTSPEGGGGIVVSLAHSGSPPNQKHSVALNFYMHADLDGARSSKNLLCDPSDVRSNGLELLEWVGTQDIIYPGLVPSTCGFCGVCCGYSLTVGEL